MKLLFMGSPDISVPFLDFAHSGSSEMMVFTQKDKIRKRGKNLEPTPVKKRALELGIAVHTLSAKTPEAIDIIREFAPDIILVVAFGQILPLELLRIPKLYPLNVHFSLLPQYRGSTPVNTALLNNDLYTGTTIMVMDEGLDTGDILFADKCDIDSEDNSSVLFEKLIKLSIGLLEKNWESISTGTVIRTPQQGTFSSTKLIKKNDLIINFNDDASKIHNKIRAFNQLPGIRTIFRNNPLFIEKSAVSEQNQGDPGKIIEVGKDFFTVSCGNEAIKILQVKPAGKRSMKAGEFINGYKPLTGEVLG
ncbi:MAG TPA: methionyl-tRNA formyltransferase [bacterium]|nr:methionyl-tRNA formyltransferase [bacterium]HPS31162.1 methionyl-tRNA formyltransferase [bacterium]